MPADLFLFHLYEDEAIVSESTLIAMQEKSDLKKRRKRFDDVFKRPRFFPLSTGLFADAGSGTPPFRRAVEVRYTKAFRRGAAVGAVWKRTSLHRIATITSRLSIHVVLSASDSAARYHIRSGVRICLCQKNFALATRKKRYCNDEWPIKTASTRTSNTCRFSDLILPLCSLPRPVTERIQKGRPKASAKSQGPRTKYCFVGVFGARGLNQFMATARVVSPGGAVKRFE